LGGRGTSTWGPPFGQRGGKKVGREPKIKIRKNTHSFAKNQEREDRRNNYEKLSPEKASKKTHAPQWGSEKRTCECGASEKKKIIRKTPGGFQGRGRRLSFTRTVRKHFQGKQGVAQQENPVSPQRSSGQGGGLPGGICLVEEKTKLNSGFPQSSDFLGGFLWD